MTKTCFVADGVLMFRSSDTASKRRFLVIPHLVNNLSESEGGQQRESPE